MDFTEIVIGERLPNIEESKIKSRAIILNEENQILIAKYAGVYMLPGGKVDEDESPDDAIYREIREETGLEFQVLTPFKKITYFQKDYPTRDGEKNNRLLTTYYYFGREKDGIKHEKNLTEKEIKGGFELKYFEIQDINQILEENKSSNPRNEFFNNEIKIVLECFQNKMKNESKSSSKV